MTLCNFRAVGNITLSSPNTLKLVTIKIEGVTSSGNVKGSRIFQEYRKGIGSYKWREY